MGETGKHMVKLEGRFIANELFIVTAPTYFLKYKGDIQLPAVARMSESQSIYLLYTSRLGPVGEETARISRNQLLAISRPYYESTPRLFQSSR